MLLIHRTEDKSTVQVRVPFEAILKISQKTGILTDVVHAIEAAFQSIKR